jgi:hypothetical protein
VSSAESAPRGLRLLVFDRTCTGAWWHPGLSHAWGAGARLYRVLGRIDAARGVSSWEEGLTWLAETEPDRPIAQIQYWGHGKWGLARVDREALDSSALAPDHRLRPWLDRIAARMLPGDAGCWWFRTCETFGARPGQRFARSLADFLGCRTAGHTYIIGHWQSGLHSLGPGEEPHWREDEGLLEGTPERPEAALWSRPGQPNTISFLHGRIPSGY